MPLIIIVSGVEGFDDEKQEFVTVGEDVTVELEHSLNSLSKWETIYKKPFLGSEDKTPEEILGYIEAMVLSNNFTKEIASRLSVKNSEEITNYISSEETATVFHIYRKGSGRQEVITSELIYYWMTAFQIPFECQYWHLSRLLALIQICNIKNSKEKAIPKREAAQQQRSLNEARRAALGTSG